MGLFKKEYVVTYKRYGCITFTNTIFIKARNLSHLQSILEKRERPWDVEIISVTEVK
jgi:hypothetical protein